jgi:hypothetical protein
LPQRRRRGRRLPTDLAPRNDGQSGGVDTGIRLATADVEATHEYLASQGVDVDDILRLPGVPLMFSLRDADGNSLYMVEAGPA